MAMAMAQTVTAAVAMAAATTALRRTSPAHTAALHTGPAHTATWLRVMGRVWPPTRRLARGDARFAAARILSAALTALG